MRQHFRRRAVEFQQGNIAEVLKVFHTLRGSIKATHHYVTEGSKETGGLLKLGRRLVPRADVVANALLLVVAQGGKTTIESFPGFSFEPLKAGQDFFAVMLLTLVGCANPFIN